MITCFCGCESNKTDSSGAGNESDVTETIQDDNQEQQAEPEITEAPDSVQLTSVVLEEILPRSFNKGIENTGNIKEAAENVKIASQMDLVIEDCTEGYLPGFNTDITGFSAGVKLQPMIGSIPFIAYIFETEDTDALLEKLNSSADPRWNICTEARNPITDVNGNYVFFCMTPADN